jgi:hypothetical protein
MILLLAVVFVLAKFDVVGTGVDGVVGSSVEVDVSSGFLGCGAAGGSGGTPGGGGGGTFTLGLALILFSGGNGIDFFPAFDFGQIPFRTLIKFSP